MRKSIAKNVRNLAIYAVQPALGQPAQERVIPTYDVREAEAAERRIVMAALGADLYDDDTFCSQCGESDCSNVSTLGPECMGMAA